MRGRDVAKAFGGAVVVYVVVAACGGGGSDAGGGPTSSSIVDAMIDAITDGTTNPVKDARAQEAPEVAVEKCSRNVQYAGQTQLAAVHSFAGRSPADLAAVRTLMRRVDAAGKPTLDGREFGYSVSWPGTFVRDGEVLALCGVAGANQVADEVTFILPR